MAGEELGNKVLNLTESFRGSVAIEMEVANPVRMATFDVCRIRKCLSPRLKVEIPQEKLR